MNYLHVAWDVAEVQGKMDDGKIDAISGGSIDGLSDFCEGSVSHL